MNKASLAKFTLAIWWGRLGSCLPKSRVNLSIMLRGEDLKAKRRIRLRQRQTEPSMQCHRRSPRYYSRDLVRQGPQGADQTTNPSLFLTKSPWFCPDFRWPITLREVDPLPPALGKESCWQCNQLIIPFLFLVIALERGRRCNSGRGQGSLVCRGTGPLGTVSVPLKGKRKGHVFSF